MNTPKLSVVIASGAGGEFLFRCLDSLEEQAGRCGAEIVVVDRCGDAVRTRIGRRHPTVRVLASTDAERPGIPQLRATGVEASTGEIVAVIEEHCVAPPHWIDTILAAFGDDDAAIGGPILDSGFRRLRDWVVYFSEYHNYLPPWPSAPRVDLNGANVAYRRTSLLAHRGVLGEGYWEVVLHPRLASGGGRLRAVPGMGVHHTGPFAFGYYLRQRYLLSRVWGGTQRHRVPPGRRIAHLVVAPVFPLFLLLRMARRVWPSRGLRGRFVAALPLLVPVVFAYTWGEWLGYLVGPGRALEQVE